MVHVSIFPNHIEQSVVFITTYYQISCGNSCDFGRLSMLFGTALALVPHHESRLIDSDTAIQINHIELFIRQGVYHV